MSGTRVLQSAVEEPAAGGPMTDGGRYVGTCLFRPAQLIPAPEGIESCITVLSTRMGTGFGQ